MAKTTQAAAIKYAFQCNYCGALEPAEAAGENPTPSACHVCRHGVRYEVHTDGTGFDRVLDPKNWTILADLTPAQLAKGFHRHGLKPDRVSRHTPKVAGPPDGRTVVASAEEKLGQKDRTHGVVS